MSDFIPLCVPKFCGNELKYITEAVKSEWVSTSGNLINKFEAELAEYLKVEKITALQSGTSGLHLAMILADIHLQNEVIVPTLTFIAAVNSVKYVGAEPIFMDCDDNLCIDANKVETFCKDECDFIDNKLINKKTGRQVKAILAVDVFGEICDIEKLLTITKKYNLKLIEDATEALGSKDKNGNFAGTQADFGIYSFNGNKIITTGGGGALVAKNISYVEKAKYLSTQAKDNDEKFIHNEIGYNYRMTNLQAALGLAQLEQLDKFIKIKQENYKLYLNNDINLLKFNSKNKQNYWFYSFLTDKKDELIKYLKENNIQSRPVWQLVHTLKPYQNCQNYKIDKAIKYHSEIVNLPCSTNLREIDILRICQIIKEFQQ